jgi:hypothetical protein
MTDIITDTNTLLAVTPVFWSIVDHDGIIRNQKKVKPPICMVNLDPDIDGDNDMC